MADTEESSEGWLEEMRRIANLPAPVAPYWEGREFPAVLEKPDPARSDEREAHFDALLAQVADERWQVYGAALGRLASLIDDEAEDGEAERASEWLRRTLGAVLDGPPSAATDLLDCFCQNFRWRTGPEQQSVILAALRDATGRPTLPFEPNALRAAVLLFGGAGETWAEAGRELLATLDDAHPNIRAAAAYQIGRLCQNAADAPPHGELLDLIRRKERERPGVAGAFWNATSPDDPADARAWLLDVLCEAPGPEPHIPYFPCHLSFDAHERFSGDPAAVRRLMDAGQRDVALAAATDVNAVVPGMEPLLIELGDVEDDPEAVRLAAWHLAYHYRRLHPRGEALGFVRRVGLAGGAGEMFLLFSGEERRPSSAAPYAAVLYPPAGGTFSRAEARAWVDRVYPEEARGERQPDEYPRGDDHPWYRRGYAALQTEEGTDRVAHVTIGWRSDEPWDPAALLQG
jgi:hypothetical protein